MDFFFVELRMRQSKKRGKFTSENFICDIFRMITVLRKINIQRFPVCNVLTENFYGCKYIKCTNKILDHSLREISCNIHWCWLCEKNTRDSAYLIRTYILYIKYYMYE